MGAVTYPDPKVARLIEENFVPIQIDVSQERPQVHEAIERYRMMWTPTIIVLDPDGKEIRRSQGFMPPDVFAPELKLGLGQVQLFDKNYAQAFSTFEEVVDEDLSAEACAEAMYWRGVAAYKRDNNAENLGRYWNELKDKFPDSPWWRKASFINE